MRGQRIRQVWAALTANVGEEDRQFVRRWLSAAEEALFWGMNLPDQYHSLAVARTALALAQPRQDINARLLARLALLHDVGKVKGDVSTWDKILTVLLHRLAPGARRWGQEGRGGRLANVRHAIHVYYHHPERSARLLRAAGAGEELAALVRRHHKAPEAGEPPELTLLRQADDLH